MRFVLDNCTSVEVRPVLVERGHECWTAHQAGLAEAQDPDLLFYAIEQGAVLVTHDVRFAKDHRATTRGQMVHLGCDHIDAAEVVERWIELIEPALAHCEDVHVRLTHEGYSVDANWT